MLAVTVFSWSSGRMPCVQLGTLLVVLWSGCLLAAEPPESDSRQSPAGDEVLMTCTIESGLLFLDGQPLHDQLTILATQDSVTVNGLSFPWQHFFTDDFEDVAMEEMSEIPQRRFADGRGRRRNQRLQTVRVARNLADMLDSGTFVVAFQGLPTRGIYGVTEENAFLQALLAQTPTGQQLQEFLELPYTLEEKQAWKNWLSNFQPDARLRTFMQEHIDRIQQVERESMAQSAALIRLDKFSYPLTLAGMILGVFALGHMLRWTGRSLVTDQGENCSPESVRCAEVALLLMLGMSAVDLLWTILAGQAGIMKEINPLAAGLIRSPASLAAFKVTATLLGCGILFAIRSRRHGQTATWWMCLVCVLVTFRWVMFDSLTS